MTVELLVIFAIICAFLGNSVAPSDKKNLGFILGLVLGPIGVLIAVLLKPKSEGDMTPTKPMSQVVKLGLLLAIVVALLAFTSY